MTAHAKLSASGAHRWLECPASVNMEQGIKDEGSPFAAEGTLAHEVAESALIAECNASHFIGRQNQAESFTVDKPMAGYVQQYLDYVRSVKGKLFIEKKVSFAEWVKDGFGTADAIILNNDVVTIVDLKYGKGVQVFPENNPQAMLYALGVLHEFGFIADIKTVNIVIVQPRLDHISEWTISTVDLLKWAKTVAKKAKMTEAKKPKFNAGEKQCQFCKAKGSCLALAELNLKLASDGFEAVETPIVFSTADTLTPDQMAAILPQLKLLNAWVKAVEAYSLTLFESGETIPGYKIVEGRSIRKWSEDDKDVSRKLIEDLSLDQIYTQKLISPTQAEKLLGKDHAVMRVLVFKPEGKPTVVLSSDKRPEIDINPTQGFENTEAA